MITINFKKNTEHSIPCKRYCYDFIYLKCLYSQHAHKVLSAMLSAVHSHKKRPYLVHSTSHPVSSSPLPQLLLLFGSLLTRFLLLSFLCYFCVFLAAETLKKAKTLHNLCLCIVFSLLLPTPTGPCYPPHIYLYLHVKGLNQLSVLFLALSGCQNT